MERVGQYVIVRELSVRAYGSVYRARGPDDVDEQGKYLIKVFNPTGAAAEEVALDPVVREALDRAAFQQQVAASGAQHWAPIFGHGICEQGAYYISLFYPSSIRRLVEARVHLQSAYLRVIAQGIVDGLIELKTAFNRPHGNLTPQTVLIELNENRQPSRVLLAEPAMEQGAAEVGELGDIKAVGQLLYQVITSRAKLEALILPLRLTEEWKYLGPAGKPWMEFVNYLLEADPTPQTHNLEQVRKRIEAIGAAKTGSSKTLVMGVAATILLAGLAGGGWYAWKRIHPSPHPQPHVIPSNYPVAERLYEKYLFEKELPRLLGTVNASAFPELATLRTRLEAVQSQTKAGVTEANRKNLDDAMRNLDESIVALKSWRVSTELDQFAEDKLPQQWDGLRSKIKDAAASTKADAAGDLHIDALVHAANWHSALAGFDWKKSRDELAGYATDFTKSGFPLLSYFDELPKDIDKAVTQATEPEKVADVGKAAKAYLALAAALSQSKANPDVTARFSGPTPEKDKVLKEAEAEIAKGSGGRAAAIASVLGTWEKRMLTIPAPKDAAVIYDQYKTSLADRQREYEAVKKWTLASDDQELTDLAKQAQESVGRLKSFVNTAAPEFQTAKDQANRILKLLQSSIKERGENRRLLFEVTDKSFVFQLKQIEELIPQAVAAGSTSKANYDSGIKALRDKVSEFERDFKTLGDTDVDARKSKLDEALVELARRIEEEIGTEPAVNINLPKFASTAIQKELARQWDDYSKNVVGQTRPKITRRQKALLEPAKANIEAFAKVVTELEKKSAAMPVVTVAGSEELQVAAKSLPAMAMANGNKLIAQAVQVDSAKKTLTIVSAKLLEKQEEWNKAAGQWLVCWSEIEKALNAGTGLAEEFKPNNPQLAAAGAVTIPKLLEQVNADEKVVGVTPADDPLKQLRLRLKTLVEFERASGPEKDEERGTWLKKVFEALKGDRLELASAAARKIANAGAPQTVQEFKSLDAVRKLMPKPAKDRLDKSLDAAVAGALSAFARQGLQKADTLEVTVKDLADLKSSLGLTAGLIPADPAIKTIIEFVKNGLGDPDKIEPTARVLADLKTTLELPAGMFAREPAIKAALAEYLRVGLKDPARIEKTAKVLADLKAPLGLEADAFKDDPAIKAAIAEYAQNGLKDAANIQATATTLVNLQKSLGLAADVYTKDPKITEVFSRFVQNGLTDAAKVQATAAALEVLKKTLGLTADAFKNDPAIKTAISDFARKGLKDAATIAATATALESLKTTIGLDADAFKNDPAIKTAIAEYAQNGLKDATNIQTTATTLVNLQKSLGLAADVYTKDPKITEVFSRFVQNGLTDAAKVQATAAALEVLKKTLGLTADGFKNDPAIKAAIAAFAGKGLTDAATIQATVTALENLRTTLGLGDDVYKSDPAIQAALNKSAMDGLKNATTVEATVAWMEKIKAAIGISPEVGNKDPFIRSNLALYRAKQAKLKETDNTAAAALARDLLQRDPSLSDDARVHKDLVAGLQKQLDDWTKYQSQLGAKGGPKEAGFSLNAQLSSDDVKVFEKKVGDEQRRLVFGRITVNGDAVFLCTTETPIWAVDALVEGGKKLGDVLGIDDPVKGDKPVPRPWFTDDDITELKIRPGWLPKYSEGFSPYPAAMRDPAAAEKLLSKTANPSKDQPLDYINPDVAQDIAKALGCRLPTSAEWLAGAAEQVNLPNLRDSSWDQVANQLSNAPNKVGIIPSVCVLEQCSYAPGKVIRSWDGATLASAVQAMGLKPKWNLPGGAYDDQHPFFWPAVPEIDPNGKPRFKDLIGNVGEYVVHGEGGGPGHIDIAGGSALSDPGAPADLAAGIGISKEEATAGKGYPDVGMRLAFTPVKEGKQPEIAKNVKELLDKAKYVTAVP